MALRLGDTVPNFTQDSTEGPLDFYSWSGTSWTVLFSHPADFTPVCTTELGAVARLLPEFEKRGVKVVALSVDSLDSHRNWLHDVETVGGVPVRFPLIADEDRSVSQLYDMIHPEASATATVRSVFIIDPAHRLRLTLTYPASTGRNIEELLRVIDSLQLTDNSGVATPVDWQPGEEVVILPAIQDPEEIERRFPAGYRAVTPYLRLTTVTAPATEAP